MIPACQEEFWRPHVKFLFKIFEPKLLFQENLSGKILGKARVFGMISGVVFLAIEMWTKTDCKGFYDPEFQLCEFHDFSLASSEQEFFLSVP